MESSDYAQTFIIGKFLTVVVQTYIMVLQFLDDWWMQFTQRICAPTEFKD